MPTENLDKQQMFSSDDDYSDIMKFVMKKINEGQNTLKPFIDYSKIDTWGGEQFAFLNEKLYAFIAEDTSTLPEQAQATMARYNGLYGSSKIRSNLYSL